MPGMFPDTASIPAVILAGGRSARMGRNKAFVALGGRPMQACIKDRLMRQTRTVALNVDVDWPDTMALRLVSDTITGSQGPLAGILAALLDTVTNHPQASHVATIPIDSPFFPEDLLSRLAAALEGREEIAIASSASRTHPVFGLWPVSAADDLAQWMTADPRHRRVNDFLMRHAVTEVDFPLIATPEGAFDPFFNINTPDDAAAGEHWLEVLSR